MSGTLHSLRSAHRRVYGIGLVLCLGTPSLIAALLLSGAVPPGQQTPVGVLQQVGYLFTGLVFLAGAWVWGRSGRMVREFPALAEARRLTVLVRESLLYALVFETSSVAGLVYWLLVGAHAGRHVWGFLLLTPLLFLALVPRFDRWAKGLED